MSEQSDKDHARVPLSDMKKWSADLTQIIEAAKNAIHVATDRETKLAAMHQIRVTADGLRGDLERYIDRDLVQRLKDDNRIREKEERLAEERKPKGGNQ
jgi:hypothetical protein